MKAAEKITFVPSKEYILRVKYKDVYVGRIILNNQGEIEWQEKGWRVLAAHLGCETFSNYEEAKSYVSDRLLTYEKTNKRLLKSELTGLTDKGKQFMKKFLDNNPVNQTELINEEKSVADNFVTKCLLEKGTLDGKVVYWSTLKKI